MRFLSGQLIAEKTGIFVDEKNKILRYDGRPFYPEDIIEKIRNSKFEIRN